MIQNLVFLGHRSENYVGFSGTNIHVQPPPDNDPLYALVSFALLGWLNTNVILLRATLQSGVEANLTISDGINNTITASISDANEGIRDSYWSFDTLMGPTWSLTIDVNRADSGQKTKWIFTKGKAV